MMQVVDVRAADADRERVLADLQQHTAAGRLSMDEFSERAAAVYRSRTYGELAALTADLPAAPSAPVATPRVSRPACIAVSVAGIALTLLGVAALTPAGSMMGCI